MATFVRTQEIEHEIGEAGRLSVRVTSPDVELRAVDDGTVRARVTFEIRAATDAEADEILERVRFRTDEGTGFLEISEPKEEASVIAGLARILRGSAGQVEARIEATAPRGADLRVDGVSADVTTTGFRGSQQYRSVSGDLVLDAVGGDVRVKGVSSDISLRGEAALPSLEINTVSGDVSAMAPRIEQLRLVTVSGDVELETRLADGPEHRVETVSGDLSLGVEGGLTVEVRGFSTDVDVRLPHRSEGSRERRRYVIGDGRPHLLFSSMSGDIEVRPPRRLAAAPPPPPAPPTPQASAPPPGDELEVLRALERGEIDVDEAARRLASGRPSDV